MHQVSENVREMLGAPVEEFKENSILWDASILFKRVSSCLSYKHVGKQRVLQHSLPIGRRRQQGKNSCWNFSPAALSSHPAWGQTAWAVVTFRREEDPSFCISTVSGDADIPELGTFFVPCSPTRLFSQKWDFSLTVQVSCLWFNINFGNLHPDPGLPYPGIAMAALRSSPIWDDRVGFVGQYRFNEQAARHWEPFPSNSCKINDGTFSSAVLQPPKIPL